MAKATHGTLLGSAVNNLESDKITPIILFVLSKNIKHVKNQFNVISLYMILKYIYIPKNG